MISDGHASAKPYQLWRLVLLLRASVEATFWAFFSGNDEAVSRWRANYSTFSKQYLLFTRVRS